MSARLLDEEGDVRIWIVLNPDRTVGSVATWVVSHTCSSLGRRGSLEVLRSFHLLVSYLCRCIYRGWNPHKSEESSS